MRTCHLVAVITAACCLGVLAADAPEAGKTGTFTVAFTARSSLTTPKERAVRLNEKPAPADYDIAKSDFLIVVADSYDPEKPMGLFILLNYKDTNDPPTPVLDLLAEKNFAFVAIKKNDMPWDEKCGATVDAVYNMQQLYKIDPTRIYLFAFDYNFCAARLTGYSDVFCATYLCEFIDYWKQITLPNRRFLKGDVPVPPARQLGVAKAHPLVISTYEPDEDQKGKSAVKAYQSDGFKNVMYVPVSHDDVHYPNYTKPWLEKVLTFFDEKRVQPKAPASKPATRAAH